ncbi:methyl-accepting chemotaxis protein [Borrelia anserina]|uniref:Methyl-accepting chemotaxis protein n=2 Tax=Borrelia anserina TaxID=143 RepID=W5SNR7_BORAN|nr:methyl-accepting chemotaxis protein [Borrelia anserina]AHH08552.1 Methyl-accepting chemotaxis protein [Borrelia anserina BA2]APR65019.1 chemotaxis protein [Borrelia anserina Es]UPA06944.1 methyl-accepting chemotaxis protein [Borrelia anserina]
MYKFSFFGSKKSDGSESFKNDLLSDIEDDSKDLNVCEYTIPVKEIIKGVYHAKSSISNVLVHIEFLCNNLFSSFESIDKVFGSLIERANDARNQVSIIFEDLEKNNEEKLKSVSTVIVGVQGSLETINNFLGATNMISLNAKLEAARAKEYGKGFSVVADEIKRLSDQAKNVMNMISVKEIEQVSKDLVSNNIKKLQLDIDSFFSSLIEELTSIEDLFKHFVGQQNDFSTLISDLENVESNVSYLARSCDSLSSFKAFMYSNDEFLKELEFSISEQMSWMSIVRSIVENQKMMAIQTDPMKHGFGLFYKGFIPNVHEVKEIWENIYSCYLDIHKLVVEIIKVFAHDNSSNLDLKRAKDFLVQAEGLSDEIISKLESVKKIVVECENQGIKVFA